MSTQIKRLIQEGTAFVPVTLSEAVVVNTTNLPILNDKTITTLDTVLRSALGIVTESAGSITLLNAAVKEINDSLKLQKNYSAGAGINISDDGTISANVTSLYKIVQSLPTEDIDANSVYIVIPNQSSTTEGNLYSEYIYLNRGTDENPNFGWEEIGALRSEIDLSNTYVTKTEYSAKINSIESTIKSITLETIVAENVIVKDSDDNLFNVVVNYDIDLNAIYRDAVLNVEGDNISGNN